MTAASPTTARVDRAAVTRSLLGYGVLAGPLYLGVGLAQALLREGFDFGRHPLSLLANGSWGWVQIGNFLVSGLMVVAAAVGFTRVLGARGASRFLGAFGVSLMAAGVFVADPVSGFPPGTPEGPPTTMTTSGLLHFLFGALGFLAWTLAAMLTGRTLSRRGERWMGRYSVLSGLVVGTAFVGGVPLSGGSLGIMLIWLSVVVGWAWLAVTSLHLSRASPAPD